MSGRWWRAYDEAVDDPKLQQLPPELFKAWFNICCITSQNGGVLPSIAHIAFKLRVSEAKASKIILELRNLNLIDENETGDLLPHNWKGRQFQSDVSTPRVKRFRKRQRNVSPGVSETPPETETDSDPNGSGEAPSLADPKKQLFDRGKEILGRKSGGVVVKLLKSFGNEDDLKAIAKARARLEEASTKANPNEWLGRVIVNTSNGNLHGPARKNGLASALEKLAEAADRTDESRLFEDRQEPVGLLPDR